MLILITPSIFAHCFVWSTTHIRAWMVTVVIHLYRMPSFFILLIYCETMRYLAWCIRTNKAYAWCLVMWMIQLSCEPCLRSRKCFLSTLINQIQYLGHHRPNVCAWKSGYGSVWADCIVCFLLSMQYFSNQYKDANILSLFLANFTKFVMSLCEKSSGMPFRNILCLFVISHYHF